MAWIPKWYGKAFTTAFSATGVDLAAGTVKAVLCGASYTPDQDVHDFADDITDEIGTRVTVTLPDLSYDAATNRLVFTCSPIIFSSVTGAIKHVVIFVDEGTDATSPLVMVISNTTTLSLTAEDFTVTPDASGLCRVTVS